MVRADEVEFVLGTFIGMQAGCDEVGEVPRREADGHGLPIDDVDTYLIGREHDVVESVVPVEDAEAAGFEQQPVGEHVGVFV